MRAFDAHGLDARDGREVWKTRIATDAFSFTDISSDARGRTTVAVYVSDTGTIGGGPMPDGGGKLWNALIALNADGTVRWTRALVQGLGGINGAHMTPSGLLVVSGRCTAGCWLSPKAGSSVPENFTVHLRM
jgi:outer membrane protein assembly factor BamB